MSDRWYIINIESNKVVRECLSHAEADYQWLMYYDNKKHSIISSKLYHYQMKKSNIRGDEK